jgi:hypothetical protein
MKLREFIDVLDEARKNPHQNPKSPINYELIKLYNETRDTIGSTRNLFISFTQINKLGIYPSSTYNTPLGIYAYPVEYVVTETNENQPMAVLPFAGEHPYGQTFKVRGNVLNINEFNDLDEWTDKLIRLYPSAEKEILKFKDSSNWDAFNKSIPGRFWYVTYRLAYYLGKDRLPSRMWNSIFRKLGIDGIVDTGNGIIHKNEHTQAVFFSYSVVEELKLLINKYSPIAMMRARDKGRIFDFNAKLYKLRQMSPEEFLTSVDNNVFDEKLIKLTNLPTRLEILKQRPGLGVWIPNPSLEEIKATFEGNYTDVYYGQYDALAYWTDIKAITPPILTKTMSPNIAEILMTNQHSFRTFMSDDGVVDAILKIKTEYFYELFFATKETVKSALKYANDYQKRQLIDYLKGSGLL